ncbi:MAG TPA: CsgG/HfaB family protein, partial [bacterium]|nr:CsgG/HfaB family protein [bacterium]
MPLRYMLAFFCVSALLFGQDKKPSIAVLDFKASEGLTRGETATLTNRFRGILVQTEAFNVVEQEKMNEILKAQDFSMSDACNTAECAVQVGQLLGVERMIAGDIGKIGDVFTIDLRLIDV